jgi:hypothetical protein
MAAAAKFPPGFVLARKYCGIEGDGVISAQICAETKRASTRIESKWDGGDTLYINTNIAMKLMRDICAFCETSGQWKWIPVYRSKTDTDPITFCVKQILMPFGQKE